MKSELEENDIKTIASAMADMLFQKLQESQHTSLVDSKGLASYLGVSPSWVYEKTRDKGTDSMPRVMVGKYVRFNIPEVLEWLKNQ